MALTATITPTTISLTYKRTCLLVTRQIDRTVATRTELFLKKVFVLDVADS